MKPALLVVDDEPAICEIVADCLDADFRVIAATSVADARSALLDDMPDVLLTDLRMPDGGGLALVRHAVARYPDLAVVLVTGHGSVEDFVTFFGLGVADFLLKPFTPPVLRQAVARALDTRRLRREHARLVGEMSEHVGAHVLVGRSAAMERLRATIARVAPTDATVLITGASGTGKELVARAVHGESRRAAGPFVPVHCGALSPELVESELFGHVRGAFTGADRARSGRFEEADGGTLFLDEVGTMPEAAQVRLLRALAEREVVRVGETSARRVDVRVVAATNANLAALAARGRFRHDLYFRLNVFPVQVPDLASRPDDVPLLAAHFLGAACRRFGRRPLALSQRALRQLRALPWPGNVRELENLMQRAAIFADGTVVEPEHLLIAGASQAAAPALDLPEGPFDAPARLATIEADLITQALERTAGNRQKAADLLGLQRTTLVQKLKRIAEMEGRPDVGDA